MTSNHEEECCVQCVAEFEEGYGLKMDGWCCCKDERP